MTFRAGERPTGSYDDPSQLLVRDKAAFGSSRAERWLGTEWTTY